MDEFDFKKVDELFEELGKIEKMISEAFKKSKVTGNNIKDLADTAILEVEMLELIEQHEKYSAMLFDNFIENTISKDLEGVTRNQLRYEKSLHTKKFMGRLAEILIG